MTYTDVDSDSTTFNSSRSTLALPSGSTVLFAGLYWGGDTSAGDNGAAAPVPAARAFVRFATPTAAYRTITRERPRHRRDLDDPLPGVRRRHEPRGRRRQRRLRRRRHRGRHRRRTATAAGASSSSTATRPSRPAACSSTTGCSRCSPACARPPTSSLSGFVTPPSGTVLGRLALLSWEGDRGLTGDSATFAGRSLSDALEPGPEPLQLERLPRRRRDHGPDAELREPARRRRRRADDRRLPREQRVERDAPPRDDDRPVPARRDRRSRSTRARRATRPPRRSRAPRATARPSPPTPASGTASTRSPTPTSGGAATRAARTAPTSRARRARRTRSGAADVGATMRVVVTATNAAGATAATSAASAKVAPAAPANQTPPVDLRHDARRRDAHRRPRARWTGHADDRLRLPVAPLRRDRRELRRHRRARPRATYTLTPADVGAPSASS